MPCQKREHFYPSDRRRVPIRSTRLSILTVSALVILASCGQKTVDVDPLNIDCGFVPEAAPFRRLVDLPVLWESVTPAFDPSRNSNTVWLGLDGDFETLIEDLRERGLKAHGPARAGTITFGCGTSSGATLLTLHNGSKGLLWNDIRQLERNNVDYEDTPIIVSASYEE
jgi:hypothetical protein